MIADTDNGYTISVSDDNDSVNDVYNYADFKSIWDEISDIDFPKELKMDNKLKTRIKNETDN